MVNPDSVFHFPTEIHLEHRPLAEVWLELQWRTEHKLPEGTTVGLPDEDVDSYYPMALGAFYQNVRKNYPVREALPTSQFPDSILPHMIRHRFRVAVDQWPVMQIGPGIATVNLIEPYTWTLFRNQAIFLQQSLLSAYKGTEILPRATILRYRNVFGISHQPENPLDFLKQKLNLAIAGPDHIPGAIGENDGPIEVSLNLGYRLRTPAAIGNIRISTALQTDSSGQGRPIILVDLEVRGRDVDVNPFLDETSFSTWLDEAHAVIHEWFFALIDGPLKQKFENGL